MPQYRWHTRDFLNTGATLNFPQGVGVHKNRYSTGKGQEMEAKILDKAKFCCALNYISSGLTLNVYFIPGIIQNGF